MVPIKDQFRAHVAKMGDGRLMCGFCHQVFAATPSLWRFKWHWSGVERHGVRLCPQVDPDTKEAASRALQQPPSKKRKSSCNMIDATSTPTRDQINEVGNLVGDQGSMRLEQGVPGQEGASSDAQASGNLVNNMPRLSQEDMINATSTPTQTLDNASYSEMHDSMDFWYDHFKRAERLPEIWLLEQGVSGQEGASSDAQASGNLVNNMPRLSQEDMQDFFCGLPVVDTELITECRPVEMTQPTEVKFSSDRIIGHALESRADAPLATDRQSTGYNAPLMEADADGTRELVQPVGGGANSSRTLPCDTSPETMEDALPISDTKLVGEAFEKNKNEIWSWLMDDAVSLIAISGMLGAGKKFLMKCIYELLIERSSTFGQVCWITVSQDFSISKLRNSFARHIDLDLSNEDDQLPKAIKLSNQLKKKQRWVLILGDLWNDFELDRIGIPLTMKRCKVILTTRFLNVCESMAPSEDDESGAEFVLQAKH